jgi:hypothetical protein
VEASDFYCEEGMQLLSNRLSVVSLSFSMRISKYELEEHHSIRAVCIILRKEIQACELNFYCVVCPVSYSGDTRI